MAKMFQCAAAMYCISSLSPEAGSGGGAVNPDSEEHQTDDIGPREATWTALAGARNTCLTILLGQLRNVKAFPQLRKFVLWPLVVAGIHVGTDDEMTQKFALEELSWISRAVGIAAPLVAKEFLQRRIWPLELGKRKWVDLFDRPYFVRALRPEGGAGNLCGSHAVVLGVVHFLATIFSQFGILLAFHPTDRDPAEHRRQTSVLCLAQPLSFERVYPESTSSLELPDSTQSAVGVQNIRAVVALRPTVNMAKSILRRRLTCPTQGSELSQYAGFCVSNFSPPPRLLLPRVFA